MATSMNAPKTNHIGPQSMGEDGGIMFTGSAGIVPIIPSNDPHARAMVA